MSVEDNLALRDIDRPPLSCRGWIDRAAVRVRARARMERFGIRAAGPQAPARTLSGGNQQKIVVAREIGRSPRVLVAIQPTWGLDPGAARFVTEEILALRERGALTLALDGDQVEVGADLVEVVQSNRPPFVAASGNGYTVALDTTLTEELVDEGLCREIVNRVQNLRKKSGLEVSDRIRLAVAGSPRAEAVAARFGEHIAGETLAAALGGAVEGLPHQDEFEVDGVRITVALAKDPDHSGGNA